MTVEKVGCDRQGEAFRVGQRMIGGQRIDRVLHRVGRDHATIVAGQVRFAEISLQRNINVQLDEIVTIRAPRHLT